MKGKAFLLVRRTNGNKKGEIFEEVGSGRTRLKS